MIWGKSAVTFGMAAAGTSARLGAVSPPVAPNICPRWVPGTGRIRAAQRGSFHRHLGKYKVLILFGVFKSVAVNWLLIYQVPRL